MNKLDQLEVQRIARDEVGPIGCICVLIIGALFFVAYSIVALARKNGLELPSFTEIKELMF